MPKEDFKIGRRLVYIDSVSTFEGTIIARKFSGSLTVQLDEPYWIRRGKVIDKKVIIHNYELEFCTTYPHKDQEGKKDNVDK